MSMDESARIQRPRRLPQEVALDAIHDLAVLPTFWRLRGRVCVVVGDSDGAAWKAELLAATGAKVRAIAAAPGDRLRDAAKRRPEIQVIERPWKAEDFVGARIVVADVDFEEAALVVAAARAEGAAVNIIDKPEYCDFSFGSVVNRSPLVAAVSTDGAAPVFAQAIRARIEALLPDGFSAWARAAKDWRKATSGLGWSFRRRRAFWEMFVARALASPERPPGEADFEALLAAADRAEEVAGRGHVVLVGAGPGDPELLTLKAVRALQTADVVLFDDLVSPEILEMARREARRINVGKRGHNPSVGQADISQLLVTLGKEGKTVVRLKGGDPTVFGRANEETSAAKAAGIACTIIPGITAALAAAAALGTSLSEREKSRRIQFVTAHAADGSLPQGLDWRALVDPDAATAVYMGVRTLPAFVAKLLEVGLDPRTPAVMVENASLPEMRTIAAPLGQMPQAVAAAAPTGPCMLLYGRTMPEAASKT